MSNINSLNVKNKFITNNNCSKYIVNILNEILGVSNNQYFQILNIKHFNYTIF